MAETTITPQWSRRSRSWNSQWLLNLAGVGRPCPALRRADDSELEPQLPDGDVGIREPVLPGTLLAQSDVPIDVGQSHL